MVYRRKNQVTDTNPTKEPRGSDTARVNNSVIMTNRSDTSQEEGPISAGEDEIVAQGNTPVGEDEKGKEKAERIIGKVLP